jgi:ElaB/YqjD/DUF883 family membrane-anchored ribosome-binding protein
MGKKPRSAGSSVDESREPDEIRQDIEASREQLGDTAAALAQKADVKTQAKQKVAQAKQSVASKKDEAVGQAQQASPDAAMSAAGQASQKARENPLPVAIAGGFAAGFVLGRLTRR